MNKTPNRFYILVFCTLAVPGLHAQTFTSIDSFDATNGVGPVAGLVEGTDANLYGTTKRGGTFGGGTVFSVSRSGTLTTIYNFCSLSQCTDGRDPEAGLVQAKNGTFYGTTYLGGANGGGTIFGVTSSGVLTTLYNFCSLAGCADGKAPTAALIQTGSGNFYGTTYDGGANSSGSIFKITPAGVLTTLYSFCSVAKCADGSEPNAGVIQGTDGNFYGTTMFGGANSAGTVYELTSSGTFTTLYSFCAKTACSDGSGPMSALFEAPSGEFYGTTGFGGSGSAGTVFQVTGSGTLTTVYSFCSKANCADGQYPYGGVIQATDGNFYGTTEQGGAADAGAVFKVTGTGLLTTLYSFCAETGCTDGYEPFAGLVQHTSGAFYGTTAFGGANGYGSIFEVSTGLRIFVEAEPTSGLVGQKVNILGDDLTGATSVQFNGTSAVFTVVSRTEITATIPKTSTSGFITVTLPAGTLTSNVDFDVLR